MGADKAGILADLNVPYLDAKKPGERLGLLVIPGGEITRHPDSIGHYNALFIKDANKIHDNDPEKAIRNAKAQGALITHNHPGWRRTTVDKNVVGEMGKMVARVKEYSPKAECIIELTWGRRNGISTTKNKKFADLVNGYPEFFKDYSSMQKVITTKATAMAQKLGTKISPVGIAWEIVRAERPEIELYTKDGSHPSYAGSYLAAAVGYLTLYNEPFKADTPIRLKGDVARYLRSVAERVVLKGEKL